MLFGGAATGIFVFGIVMAVLGTLFGLPEMRARLQIDMAQQGNVFLLLFMGILVSTLVAGPAIDSSEIESRPPEIASGGKQAGDEPLDLALEASATLANDPSLANDPPPANDPPATVDQPVSVGDDPLDRLSLLIPIPTDPENPSHNCREAS